MKKNIAILSSSLTSGGAERIAGSLSVYLSKRYTVYIFLMDSSNISYNYSGKLIFCAESTDEDICSSVKRLKKEYAIDCAISFCYGMNLINVRTKGTETVILSHRNTFSAMQPYLYRVCTKMHRWYHFADKIVSVSYGATEDLIKTFGIQKEKITTIYNFLNKKETARMVEEKLPDEVEDFLGDSVMLLNVGRLDRQKNQKRLLVQFSKVRKEYDVKLVILGSGDMEDELKQIAIDLGVSEDVLFCSYCRNPFPFYRRASVFVLSSDWEGLPGVLLEAMFLGIPIVSVNCPSGPLELIKGDKDYSVKIKSIEVCERGILIEQADTDTTGETGYLAEGVKQLLGNAELCKRMSDCEKTFANCYSNEKILQKWIDVIENAIPCENVPDDMFGEIIKGYKRIIVYGAGGFGKMTMEYIMSQDLGDATLCFAVSDKSRILEAEVMGVPVYEISELVPVRDESIVFIGVYIENGNEDAAIEKCLKYGFKFTFADFPVDYF